jgi:hypothetical protein
LETGHVAPPDEAAMHARVGLGPDEAAPRWSRRPARSCRKASSSRSPPSTPRGARPSSASIARACPPRPVGSRSRSSSSRAGSTWPGTSWSSSPTSRRSDRVREAPRATEAATSWRRRAPESVAARRRALRAPCLGSCAGLLTFSPSRLSPSRHLPRRQPRRPRPSDPDRPAGRSWAQHPTRGGAR